MHHGLDVSSLVWSSRLSLWCDEGPCCLWMCVWISTLAGVVLLTAIPLVSAVSDLEGLIVRLPFTSFSGLSYRMGQVCLDAVLWPLMAFPEDPCHHTHRWVPVQAGAFITKSYLLCLWLVIPAPAWYVGGHIDGMAPLP